MNLPKPGRVIVRNAGWLRVYKSWFYTATNKSDRQQKVGYNGWQTDGWFENSSP